MLSQINNKIKTFDQNKIQHDKVIEPILTPDYFLPASQSESYYSRKYGGSIIRISRIVSASLLSAMVLTATLDAKAQSAIESNQSFLFGKGSAGISTGGIGGGGI